MRCCGIEDNDLRDSVWAAARRVWAAKGLRIVVCRCAVMLIVYARTTSNCVQQTNEEKNNTHTHNSFTKGLRAVKGRVKLIVMCHEITAWYIRLITAHRNKFATAARARGGGLFGKWPFWVTFLAQDQDYNYVCNTWYVIKSKIYIPVVFPLT